MAKHFSRAEFHQLVWSRPMTHLAKEFGLSDVALHKICRKHGVPTPPVGWWAKKASGKPAAVTALPKVEEAGTIRIVSPDHGLGDPGLVAVRDAARVRASDHTASTSADPVVERTLAELRKAASGGAAWISTGITGLIPVTVGVASLARLEQVLQNLAAAAAAQGFTLRGTETGAAFASDDQTLTVSITELEDRTPHVLTEAEEAALAAWEKKRDAARKRNSWSYFVPDRPAHPQWDRRANGRLKLEFESVYLYSGRSPRRSFSDTKHQELEAMSSEIAVALVVLAAAKTELERRRAAQAQAYEDERRRRHDALRDRHVAERRSQALTDILDEIGDLQRLRRLLDDLAATPGTSGTRRVAAFLRWGEDELSRRQAGLCAEGLEARFENARLFGDDDGEDFRPPCLY